MKLYIYDHCPYCVRVRMIIGLKKIAVDLVILLNDDEQTPINLIGKKMVPILQKEDTSYMPESMDIVHYLDDNYGTKLLTGSISKNIMHWLECVNNDVNKLVLPRYAKADFVELKTESARRYFSDKKEAYLGSFAEHLKNTPVLIARLDHHLQQLNTFIQSENACNGVLSINDIQLFPILRELTIVKGVKFPHHVKMYLEKMAQRCNISLLEEMAS